MIPRPKTYDIEFLRNSDPYGPVSGNIRVRIQQKLDAVAFWS